MKIALCAAEVVPFVKTGGLADVAGTLPLALEKLGEEVIIFLPRYKNIDTKQAALKKINDAVSTTTLGNNITVYLIENDPFYRRDGLYGDAQGDYSDNLERFQFFCWKIPEVLKQLKISVDIVHCHDWQTGLIPAYLKFAHHGKPLFQKTKSVMTIHNLAYQGVFPKVGFTKLRLDKKLFSTDGFEFYNQVNFLKGGIVFSDAVTTVSPQYAREIKTSQFGCGLEGVLRHHKGEVAGILNGLDYETWNPESDPLIAEPFSAENIQKKYANKRRLQEQSHLPAKNNVPVFGYVGRLVNQKGFDLLAEAIDELMKLDLQLVILGVGEEKYQQLLKKLAAHYPDKIACHLEFSERMAHLVYAGSDLFLMPSWYEPCGLSQMISLRYGTIPIVHKTGGLADTVMPFDSSKGQGNGFVFEDYSLKDLLTAVKTALKIYHKKDIFQALMVKGMNLRFSWDHSAREYQKVFKRCLASG